MDETQQPISTPSGPSKKALFIIGGALALIIIASIFWWMTKKDTTIGPALSQSLEAASTKQSTGDYEGALEELKSSESEARTKEEKLRLYSEMAAAASSAGKLDEALSYYGKKHDLAPESKKADGYIIGTIYERKEDPKKALEYYRLYAEYLKTAPEGEMGNAQQESIAETIRSLEEQTQ